MFEYVHNIHGRLRLRSASLKANGALARDLQIALMRIAGVRSVEVNLLTGSVLILHDGEESTIEAISKGLCPFTRSVLCASMRSASQGQLVQKATRKAASSLMVAALEELLMASVAILL